MGIEGTELLNDLRITRHKADVNGRTYQYILGLPTGDSKDTIFLIHGWPDISIGWRNQIPLLVDMGLRVVVPDMMGYGGTDAPPVPENSLSYYTFKRAADDVKELAKQLGSSHIMIGGHDWGGAVVYRVLLWHPELVKSVIAVCTPYQPPAKEFIPLEMIVKKYFPNWGYQLQLKSGEVEKVINSREKIRQFLNTMYGGRTPNGKPGFSTNQGLIFENLGSTGPTPLLTVQEMDYYVDQYSNHGIHGTLNWYRTREQNFKDELDDPHFEDPMLKVPILFISASKDAALPPAMSMGMNKFIPNLTRREVHAGHWALWEAKDAVNAAIKEWIERAIWAAGKSTL
ncbi:MAG: hypothetical protein MMC33_008776 [Icmadophila ericetorum]|nr:hypothetical protein [Icmadophila ericetorum]